MERKIRNPIIILTFPRSGSSLVTNIFYQHGFEIGKSTLKANQNNPDGYFENQKVKTFLANTTGGVRSIYNNGTETISKEFKKNFMEILKDENLSNTDWVLKLNSGYYDLLKQVFPNAVFVCTRRKKQSSFDSLDQTNFNYPKELWEWNNDLIHRAALEKNATTINYENLIIGDYREIKWALKEAGTKPNEEILNNVIKPAYKHH